MFQRGWFLVDAPDSGLASTIVDVVQRYGVARAFEAPGSIASSLARPRARFDERAEGAAWSALLAESGRVAGIVVQVGVDAPVARLQGLRAAAPSLSMLALVETLDWELVNTAQQLGVEVALLPVQLPNLVSFVQRALSASFLPHEGVARVVAELARARELSAREVQILTYCLGNEPRARVRRRLGIAENTLKTQIRSLLRKCDARSVDALAKNVLRVALLEGREQKRGVSAWRPVSLAKSA